MEDFTTLAFDFVTTNGLKILFILIIGYIIGKIGKIAIKKGVEKIVVSHPDEDETAEQKREDTLTGILSGTFKILLWIVIGLMVLSEFSVDIGPLIAGAGIIGIAVGFGGQYLIKDLITGLFIILENQYRIGDAVEINEFAGSVEDITLRKTSLRDLDGNVHHIPHGEINIVTNKSQGFAQININFGIAYESDIDKAIEMINQVGQEMFLDEKWKMALKEAPYFKRVQELGDSAVVLKILGQTGPGQQWDVAGEVKMRLKKACDAEGISIPYPQMTIHKA